jgi:hypothetical protein
MNYRRGFHRVYAVLTVAWVVVVLFTQPHDSLKFWQAIPIPTFEELSKSLAVPPEIKLGANSAVAWNSDWTVLEPQPASRTQKVLWLSLRFCSSLPRSATSPCFSFCPGSCEGSRWGHTISGLPVVAPRFVRLFRLSTMSDFRTCELCDLDYNAATFNAASNPHRCEPEALVARIVALKEALKSERKRSQPKQGCGHTVDCAVHNSPALPSGPCDCGATLAPELHSLDRHASMASSELR